MPHVQLNPGSAPSSKIITGATPIVTLGDFFDVANGVVGQPWDLELVSSLTRADGTTVEITDMRRAVGKAVRLSRNSQTISFADIDLDRLTQTYPFKTFTVADFARLYVDHVGRVISDFGPGTHLKVPMTLVADGSGAGPWVFAFAESRAGMSYTINTIYRDGQVVSASEYTAGTTTGASTGVVVRHASFTREQRDFGNRLYNLEADISVTGATREPSTEIARLLQLFGVSIDSASFTTAAAVDSAAGILADAAYTKAKTGRAIVEDLLKMARADLQKGANGVWGLVQEKVRSSVVTYIEASDLLQVESYAAPDVPIETRVNYRPAHAGNEDFAMPAQTRATGGPDRADIIDLPYCYDGNVADRLADYYSKRSRLWTAEVEVRGAQWDPGDVMTIVGNSCWIGSKSFVPRGVTRVADGNRLSLREYDANIFTYSAGTVPANAGNTYAADLSRTPPVAPTGLTVVSQGTSQATAYALIRAVPPTSNWAYLVAQIRNTVTNEIYQATLQLVSGNYEATISGLKTGTSHQVTCYAVSPTNVQGAIAGPNSFTSSGVAAYISDSHINSGGVGAVSIASGSINQGRSNTATGSFSTSTMSAGAAVNVAIDVFCFMPSLTTPIGSSNSIFLRSSVVTKIGAGDIARFAFTNTHATDSGRVDIDYRIFQT